MSFSLYRLRDLRDLASAAGFVAREVWTDERDYFSVHYLAVRDGSGEGAGASALA